MLKLLLVWALDSFVDVNVLKATWGSWPNQLVAEDTRSKGIKSSKSLFDPPINVRAKSKIAGYDGTDIAEIVIEDYEATAVTY